MASPLVFTGNVPQAKHVSNTRAVRNLALQYPKSPFHSGPFLIYLTARSAERGAEAVKTLNDDPRLKNAKVLAQDGGETTIKFHELDIGQTKSIQDFSTFLKNEHPDGIDIVVNNAGIMFDGMDLALIALMKAVQASQCKALMPVL